jgi:Na+/melibiose symporter-like transporter
MNSITGSSSTAKTFSVGNLIYTRIGVFTLFSWLLWGDFMFQMMEAVEPKILPLLLKQHGATNQQITFIASSIMMLLNVFMCPLISYNSDRTRSRWGRRRPYIIFTTPLVVICLAVTPFAPEILQLCQKSATVTDFFALFSIPPIILIFGTLVVLYQIFNLFVASVYYYLIPDVVPQELLGRFYSLFRIFSGLSGLVFNYFILGYAETHARTIFVSIAVLYGVTILLMCWKVKEGEYPPPAAEDCGKGIWHGVSSYFKESFSNSYYWLLFLGNGCVSISLCANIFYIFLYKDNLNYTLDQYGKLCAYAIVLQIICFYFAGIIIDRWGAHKTYILGLILTGSIYVAAFFFTAGYWSGFLWYIIPAVSGTLLLASCKVEVLTFPNHRYGQFCSAQALIKSLLIVTMNFALAACAEYFKTYWFINLWRAFFLFTAALLIIMLYRKFRHISAGECSSRQKI